MLRDGLRAILDGWGVTPPDVNRAGLYYTELDQTRTFLFTTLAADPVIGPVYARFRDALRDPRLLDDFCEILDQFVVEAVDGDLRARQGTYTTYNDFFDRFVFNANPGTYQNNVNTFYTTYAATRRAVLALTANFQTNVQQACQRVQTNWLDLQATFIPDGATLSKLVRIVSTGSDFHKGGKQVLLLTFTYDDAPISPFGTGAVELTQVIVYKPSDLEVHCLIAGDTAAVNAIHPGFQNRSLLETINDLIAANPNHLPNLEKLPTHKVLPYNWGSSLPPGLGGQIPIRDSYGYLEFLEHVYAPGLNILNFYPFGSSDYKIFPSQDAPAIARRFYRQLGEWVALCCSFSITDMHVENVIASKYSGNLIDLEICLTSLMNAVNQTELFGPLGGITGSQAPDPPQFSVTGPAGSLQITAVTPTSYRHNRLWTVNPNRILRPEADAPADALIEGMLNGLSLIETGVNQNPNVFNQWFTRLTNAHGCIVRYLPYSTTVFKGMREDIYSRPHATQAAYVNEAVMAFLTAEYHQYQAAPTPEPDFLAAQPAYVTGDYMNCDIPIFYSRINTSDIMDSSGTPVQVPLTIMINNPNPPPPATVLVLTNIGRNTFFPAPPTPLVQVNQINAFANLGFWLTRSTQLLPTLLAALGLNQVPPYTNVIH